MTAGGMPRLVAAEAAGAAGAAGRRSAISTVNHLAGPWSQRMLKDLVVQVRTDLMAQVIQPWRFTSPEAKLTVHIRDRAPERRSCSGCCCTMPATPSRSSPTWPRRARDHQAGRPGLPAHGEGPHRAPHREGGSRRRSSPSSAMWWMPTSSSSAAIRPRSSRPRERYTDRAPQPRPEGPRLQGAIPAASPPSCTSALQAPSMRSPSCSSCWPSWARPAPPAPAACRL